MRKVIKASKTGRSRIAQLVGQLSNMYGVADIVSFLADVVPEETIIDRLQSVLDQQAGPEMTSQVSFDFIYPRDYSYGRVTRIAMDALDQSGVTAIAADIDSVDYSGYPEYEDENVAQCTVDFVWTGTYDSEIIQSSLEEAFEEMDYQIIGFDFRALEK